MKKARRNRDDLTERVCRELEAGGIGAELIRHLLHLLVLDYRLSKLESRRI